MAEGIVVPEIRLFGKIKTVSETRFAESPIFNLGAETLQTGLGIVIEPIRVPEASNPDLPVLDLHNWPYEWDEVTVPLNNNLVLAGHAPFLA